VRRLGVDQPKDFGLSVRFELHGLHRYSLWWCRSTRPAANRGRLILSVTQPRGEAGNSMPGQAHARLARSIMPTWPDDRKRALVAGIGKEIVYLR
jgi:hypothetical protein